MEKSRINRRSKGCFDYVTKAHRIDNIRYDSCIGNYAVPIEYYIEAFRLYEKGILPFPGGLADQPNKIIAIFNLIEVRRTEIADRLAKGK